MASDLLQNYPFVNRRNSETEHSNLINEVHCPLTASWPSTSPTSDLHTPSVLPVKKIEYQEYECSQQAFSVLRDIDGSVHGRATAIPGTDRCENQIHTSHAQFSKRGIVEITDPLHYLDHFLSSETEVVSSDILRHGSNFGKSIP